jgi:hypothetical protein
MLDDYWDNYDRCLDRITVGTSAAELIGICNQHFDPSVAQAFFPGGSDRSLLGTLMEARWETVWVQADYHFAAKDANGDGITYVEGDIYRGVQPRNPPREEKE